MSLLETSQRSNECSDHHRYFTLPGSPAVFKRSRRYQFRVSCSMVSGQIFPVTCASNSPTDYFNPIQIELFARPPRSNLRSLSSSTVDKASAASPSPRTINETVSRLKRPFSDMNSPNQDVDYSPGRIPPIKRQRIVTFSSPTRIPKSFHITSPTSKTNVESIQNRMDVSQRYESSASSCSNSTLNKCSPFPSMLQPFPLIDLGRVISLTRRSSKRNSRPRSKFPLNIR